MQGTQRQHQVNSDLHSSSISTFEETNCEISVFSIYSAITGNDERRQATLLISHFIRNTRFGRDFERQLTFYADARANFPNLDGVFIALVQCVNLLSIKTRRIVGGRHTHKTTAFVKSCAAYCFITIPSIASVVSRMDLYLMSGQVALLNLCFGQADAFFEAAINLVMELPKTCEIDGKPKSTESYLISFISNLLSSLIIVPVSFPPFHTIPHPH